MKEKIFILLGKVPLFSNSDFGPIIMNGCLILLLLFLLMVIFGLFSNPLRRAASHLRRVAQVTEDCKRTRRKKHGRKQITPYMARIEVLAGKAQKHIDIYLYDHPNDTMAKVLSSYRTKVTNSAEAVVRMVGDDKAVTLLLDNIVKQSRDALSLVDPQ
jgi:hypothetical protein